MRLAIETATPVCSIALEDNSGTIREKKEIGKGIHSEKLFLFIEELVNKNSDFSQVSEILMSSGPGSYTGLRIGAAAVKGLLFRSEAPLRTLGSLEAIAAGVLLSQTGISRLHSVIDARREHLYHQQFIVKGKNIEVGKVAVQSIDDIDSILRNDDVVAGTGLERLSSVKSGSVQYFDSSFICASNLIRARDDLFFTHRFTLENPSDYEPDYVSIGQIRI